MEKQNNNEKCKRCDYAPEIDVVGTAMTRGFVWFIITWISGAIVGGFYYAECGREALRYETINQVNSVINEYNVIYGKKVNEINNELGKQNRFLRRLRDKLSFYQVLPKSDMLFDNETIDDLYGK